MSLLCSNDVSRPFNFCMNETRKLFNGTLTTPFQPPLMFERHAIEPRLETLASKKPKSRKSSGRSTKREQGLEKKRGTVLVVDDVPDVTEMIELLLKHAGYDVSTADSAKAALKLARKHHYDLIISDIGMPEMNGYELAAELRKLIDYDHTPMIAVTGYSEYDDRGRAVNAGFDMHLTKPIEPIQLLELMQRLLTQSKPGTNH